MASLVRGRRTERVGPVGGLMVVVLGGLACDSPLSLIELRVIGQAQSRWEARGFADYQFEIRRSCFCAPEVTQWTRVTVRNGFDLASAGDQPALGDVSVTFEPALGYPTRVHWKAAEGVLDGGLLDELRNAQATPPR
jgi:hypothetical protein